MSKASLDAIATSWTFVSSSNTKMGPFSLETCVEMFSRGEIDADTNVWSWDGNCWVKIREMKHFYRQLKADNTSSG